MQAEYYALSTAMREVIPIREQVTTMGRGMKLEEACQTRFKTTVSEDNVGALTLANLDPGRTTPRSKFYDSKVHWFRSFIGKDITVEKIESKEQLADLFAKPLPREVFRYLRKKIMGW